MENLTDRGGVLAGPEEKRKPLPVFSKVQTQCHISSSTWRLKPYVTLVTRCDTWINSATSQETLFELQMRLFTNCCFESLICSRLPLIQYFTPSGHHLHSSFIAENLRNRKKGCVWFLRENGTDGPTANSTAWKATCPAKARKDTAKYSSARRPMPPHILNVNQLSVRLPAPRNTQPDRGTKLWKLYRLS